VRGDDSVRNVCTLGRTIRHLRQAEVNAREAAHFLIATDGEMLAIPAIERRSRRNSPQDMTAA
jgi:hypothetical protein